MHLAKVERNADNGAVYTWGANPRGQLGHGHGADAGYDDDEAVPSSSSSGVLLVLIWQHAACMRQHGGYESI